MYAEAVSREDIMLDWRALYEQKISEMETALDRIPRGGAVFISPGATEPVAMRELIADFALRKGWRLVIPWSLVPFPRKILESLASSGRPLTMLSLFRIHSRDFGDGLIDYVPLAAADIPRFFSSISPRGALITVSKPDRFGYLSLGPSVDMSYCLAHSVPHMVGIVNSQVPRTFGDTLVHAGIFDSLVRLDFPLSELSISQVHRSVDEKMARHLISIIPDEAILDLRAGRIHPGVLRNLIGDKRLSIRSEYISDWILEILESREEATLWEEDATVTTSSAMGTSRMYEFLHDNPMVRFVRLSHLWNTRTSRRPFVTILGGGALDLSGRLLERDTIPSAMSERMDSILFAKRSSRAFTVVLLPSRDTKGRSTLHVPGNRPSLLPPQYVDYVVTDYGVARLTGKNMVQRAQALIEVAHPDDRRMLLARAKAYGILPFSADVLTHEYPTQLVEFINIFPVLTITVRPATPADGPLLIDLYYSMKPEDLKMRFFGTSGTLEAWKGALASNMHSSLVLIAEDIASGQILGQCEYRVIQDSGTASVALAVKEPFRRKGIARTLLIHLVKAARHFGIKSLLAEVLTYNQPTVALFRSLNWKEVKEESRIIKFEYTTGD